MSKPISVLVVDDDPFFLDLVVAGLEHFGEGEFRVRTAASLQAAYDCLDTGPVDICLIDYYLGTQVGDELVLALEGLQSGIPSILMTAYDLNELKDKADVSGAMAFMSKQSIKPATLAKDIRAAMAA